MLIVFVKEREREVAQSPTVVAFLDEVCGFGEVLLQACQGGEWGELRGTAVQRHSRMRPRNVVREAKDVGVGGDGVCCEHVVV